MGDEEVVVPLPARPAPLSAVRSTLIASSVRALFAHGHEAAYLARLGAEHREVILRTTAGVWLPVAVAEAHYGACDALNLTQSATLDLGRAVGKDTSDFFLRLVLRLANEAGTTPWTVLKASARYWSRFYVGSAVGVTKLGPKEARVHLVSTSLARYAYWRTAFRGILGVMHAPFCNVSYVREIAATAPNSAQYRISWA